MPDYATFSAARRAFSEELAKYHFERLRRQQEVEQLEAEATKAYEELVNLEQRAKTAAGYGRRGMSGGGAPPTPAVLDRSVVEEAINAVNKSPGYNDGWIAKMEIKAGARRSAAYLASIPHLFEGEKEQLASKYEAKQEVLTRAIVTADAGIKKAAAQAQVDAAEFVDAVGASAQPIDHPSWASTEWEDEGGIVRLVDAYHWIGADKFKFPYLAKVPGQNVFVFSSYGTDKRKQLVNEILLRAVRSVRPGRVRLLLVDPTSLGNIFAPLLSLGQHSETIITTKVWSTEADIRSRLEEESERVGLVIQKYLTDEYETLEEYNQAAGEVAEESVVIAINDFPRGLDQRSIEIVKSLSEVGPRCGVSVLLLQAESVPKELYAVCNEIANTGHKFGHWKVADSFRNWDSYSGSYRPYTPDLGGDLLDKVGSFLDIYDYANGSVTWRSDSYTWVSGDGRGWHAEPAEWHADIAEGVLETASRGFAAGALVEVDLDKVWQLFAESRSHGVPMRISEPDTLWGGSSLDQLLVPVGRHGSRGVSTFSFDSQLQSSALLVGRPGSGKSNLLHVIICTLAAMYPPAELELYLLDFKEAVEFAGYASGALPHARAIALESDREFGLAVLRHLGEEIERRGRLFREDQGEQTNIITYRSNGNRPLPRILLLIDEFHRLFDREDALANEAAKYLDDIVRLGRGFGIHALLASQTLLGMSGLGRHTLNQIAIRAALQCSDEDSRIVFGEDNPVAALLTRPGEAVKNTGGGRLANNEPFQVPLLSETERHDLLRALEMHARAAGHQRTTRVYRRDVQAPWRKPTPATNVDEMGVRFGDAVAIDPDMVYPLTREGGCNVLVVGRSETIVGEMLAAAMTDLRLRHGNAVDLTVFDFMAVDGPVALAAEAIGATVVRRRDFAQTIVDLAREVENTEPTRDRAAPTRVFIVNGLGKARDLDSDDYSEEAQELARATTTVIRDGPEVDIHMMIWADTVATVDRRLGRLEREFGARVLFRMPSEDSMRLCDTDLASDLREREAILTDIDRGTSVKFQPFAAPDLSKGAGHSEEVGSIA